MAIKSIEKAGEVFPFERLVVRQLAIPAIGVVGAIEICLDEPGRHEIAFLQTYLQTLLAVLFIDVQLFLRIHGTRDDLGYHRKQLADMPVQTMERELRRLVVSGPVEKRAVIFKVLADLEGAA